MSLFLFAISYLFAQPLWADQKDIPLAWRPDLVTKLEVHSNPNKENLVHIPVSGPWMLVSVTSQYRVWKAPLPIRPRSLFFQNAPKGMKVTRRQNHTQKWNKGTTLRHAARRFSNKNSNTWAFSSHALFVRRGVHEGPPQSWEYAFQYPKARSRELQLRQLANQSSKVFRNLQLEDTNHQGLLLPAPSTINFSVTIPEQAVLTTKLVLLPPEAADPQDRSDGVTLRIAIGEQVIHSQPAKLGQYEKIRVDLSQFAGQKVNLSFHSDAGQSNKYDYLFVADPVIYQPQVDPKRIILVFIDTLRQDTLSLYGYHRPTTPKLDQWAKDAAVFSNARSVAPWTLPSARSMMTGNFPERWDKSTTIQEKFSHEGWATAFLAGNIYLSSSFDFAKNWGTHRCVNWPIAEVQISRAEEILQENHDRPVMMLLHLMDMHLPYTEPLAYRDLFSGPRPEAFASDTFTRSKVFKAVAKSGDVGKQYVRDRYDNNLRYIDDQLDGFLQQFQADRDTIAIFSDHGEEFWEHKSFEHGHTFYDELLRVPMIIRSPDLQAGLYDDPISLLELAPTIARSGGIKLEKTDGIALQDRKKHDLFNRPLAFGRKLYGHDGWASLYQNKKYITKAGKEQVFDLSKDPSEKQDIATDQDALLRGRVALQEALQSKVVEGFRILLNRRNMPYDALVELATPAGFAAYWQGSDPTKKGHLRIIKKDDMLLGRFTKNHRGMREMFVIPNGDIKAAAQDLKMTLKIQGSSQKATTRFTAERWPSHYPSRGQHLYKAYLKGRTATLTYAIMPLPLKDGKDLDGTNAEVSAELKALGYMDD